MNDPRKNWNWITEINYETWLKTHPQGTPEEYNASRACESADRAAHERRVLEAQADAAAYKCAYGILKFVANFGLPFFVAWVLSATTTAPFLAVLLCVYALLWATRLNRLLRI